MTQTTRAPVLNRISYCYLNLMLLNDYKTAGSSIPHQMENFVEIYLKMVF